MVVYKQCALLLLILGGTKAQCPATPAGEVPWCLPGYAYGTPPPVQHTHTTEEDIRNFFLATQGYDLNTTSGLQQVLGDNIPRNILIAGASRGIGRALACHFANAPATETVISLASTNNLNPSTCDGGSQVNNKIKHHVYDISEHLGCDDLLRNIFDAEGIKPSSTWPGGEYIDLLVLGAVRDLTGPMRLWKGEDIQKGFDNNVFGHHAVWQVARDYFNPEFAVTMGITSVAAESRLFSMRSFYHMSKQAMADLILGYGVEEAEVQPHTYYSLMYQGDVSGTDYGLKQIIPSSLNPACEDAIAGFGMFSNGWINCRGTPKSEVAIFYHKAFAMIKTFAEDVVGTNSTVCAPFPVCTRGMVPQTFTIEPEDAFTPLENVQFNHRILPPNAVNMCYDQVWHAMNATIGAPPINAPRFYSDPRAELVDYYGNTCETMCEKSSESSRSSKSRSNLLRSGSP